MNKAATLLAQARDLGLAPEGKDLTWEEVLAELQRISSRPLAVIEEELVSVPEFDRISRARAGLVEELRRLGTKSQ